MKKIFFDTSNQAFKSGHQFTWGVLIAITQMLLILFGVVILFNTAGFGIDETDRSGWHRSGLRLHTDAQTGLQYLSTKNGALIPRIDKNGKHMRKDKQ